MATTVKGKEPINRKEKRDLSPSGRRSIEQKRGLSAAGPRSIDQSTGRRTTPKSSIAGSNDTHNSFLSEKPIPNHLKGTVTSGLDVSSKHGKKQPPEDKRLLRRRSFDKPPSPSHLFATKSSSPSQPLEVKKLLRRRSLDKPPSSSPLYGTKQASPTQIHKTPVSSTSRERTLNSLPPSTKTTSSPKITSERIIKTSRSGKMQPIVSNSNSKIIKRSPSGTIKKEAKVTVTTSSSSIPRSSEVKHDKEEKEIIAEKVQEEEVKIDSEVFDDPPILELNSIDLADLDSEIPDEVKSEPFFSSTLPEEQEHVVVEAPEIEESEEKTHDDDHHEDLHGQDHEDINNNNVKNNGHEDNADKLEENFTGEPQEEAEAKEGENATESSSVHKANVAPHEDFGDGKVLDNEEREDVEVNEEVKPEPENVILKQQNVHGKKETQAYNDVIEETASKLVGKRKGKVLALVGAFETVISLEEGQTPRADESS